MNTKIQFLKRLDEKASALPEILEFLKINKLITDDKLKELSRQPRDTWAASVYILLHEASSVLSLIDYEWKLLPEELMKLSMYSNNGHKTISWPT